MKMTGKFDEKAWKELVELAEGNVSGNLVTYKKVAMALKPICSNPVYSEYLDIALKGVDSAVGLKLRSWLDWYVLHQELEASLMPKFLKKFFIAGQIVFLSVLFALTYLFDYTAPSNIASDAKIILTMYGLLVTTFLSQIFGNIVNLVKIRGVVAKQILNSINRIHSNQQIRK